VNVIHPKRIKNLMERGNKPEDGETKIMPSVKFKKEQARRTPSGSRRPRNKGRG
jgi:hypothetical protein